MVCQNFPVARQVVLFEGRGRKGGFGVEKTGKLAIERLSLQSVSRDSPRQRSDLDAYPLKEVFYLGLLLLLIFTRLRRHPSRRGKLRIGMKERFGLQQSAHGICDLCWEHTWDSKDRACWRSCAQPVPDITREPVIEILV